MCTVGERIQPLTAVEIAKGSPHPLEEKMLIVFDRSAQSFTENNAHVVSVFNYPTTKLNMPPQTICALC